jgi:hypothetical protein
MCADGRNTTPVTVLFRCSFRSTSSGRWSKFAESAFSCTARCIPPTGDAVIGHDIRVTPTRVTNCSCDGRFDAHVDVRQLTPRPPVLGLKPLSRVPRSVPSVDVPACPCLALRDSQFSIVPRVDCWHRVRQARPSQALQASPKSRIADAARASRQPFDE